MINIDIRLIVSIRFTVKKYCLTSFGVCGILEILNCKNCLTCRYMRDILNNMNYSLSTLLKRWPSRV